MDRASAGNQKVTLQKIIIFTKKEIIMNFCMFIIRMIGVAGLLVSFIIFCLSNMWAGIFGIFIGILLVTVPRKIVDKVITFLRGSN